jgi:aspartate/methionine/tyrosine aminotransferase
VVLDCENFILQRGFKSSIELAHDILDITGVGVVPGTDFGWPNSLRLSFCSARFEEGIDRLRRYFS